MLVLNRAAYAVLALALAAPAQAQSGDEIAQSFRGKITYQGSANGTMSSPTRIPSRLTFNSILQAAGGNAQPVQSGITYDVEYDGSNVRATFTQRGALSGRGSATGTRSGDVCEMVTDLGIRFTATCTTGEFSSAMKYSDPRGRTYKIDLITSATGIVDYVERDRQQAIAAQHRQAEAAATAARYAALPNAGPALTQRLDGFVQTDSRGWAFNRYNSGTVRNVKIVDGTVKSGSYVMRGDYTYNGGAQGWVMAKMTGGKLECIQFWDAVVGCRGLRTEAQGQAMRDAFFSAAAGGGSSQSGPSDADAQALRDAARGTYKQTYGKECPNC